MLDQSGDVIVLGNIFFLRADQVAKSMEKLFCQAIAKPNDPRRIDKKVESMVKAKLYGWWPGLYSTPNIGLHETQFL
ncbi:hypothetical protein Leryth_014570 [Lithospermum erythrorhizon]|nr:hypothetical protein Leryth_014570 [Lithospermum erythrorhizon]